MNASSEGTWDQRFRRWSHSRPLPAALALVAIPGVISIVLAALPLTTAEWDKALITAGFTLLFGGLIGGMLKIFLEDYAATKRQREDNAQFVDNVLRDLKAVYDRVGRARILIAAHRSAKTYGDEMRDLIAAQVQLKNVKRALLVRAEGFSDDARDYVSDHVETMLSYLERLTDEFQKKYKKLADKQRVYEAEISRASEQAKRGEGDVDGIARAVKRSAVWDDLKTWPEAKSFMGLPGAGKEYADEFENPLDKASEKLREQLSRILSK